LNVNKSDNEMELFKKALIAVFAEKFDRECAVVEGEFELPHAKDPATGTSLCPGHPKICLGAGWIEDFECCCDECDYLAECFPISNNDNDTCANKEISKI